MKKSLIALAVAGIASAPMAANAAGTAYAQVQVEISSIDDGGVNGAEIAVADNARGRFGYKGSEELGNGMTMIGKMEYKMDTADGDSSGSISLTKREMFVGIKGGMATFTMGRLKSPYKYAGGVKYDAFVTTALEARDDIMTSGALGHNSFLSNMVGVSALGGKLYAVYGPEEGDGKFSISYKHKMGKKNEMIFAHISDGDASDYAATKVGGKFGGFKFQVEATDDGTNTDSFIFVAYGMKAAGGKVIFQGGQADGDSYTDGTTSIVAGYQKKFTKKSRWFAGIKSNSGDEEDQNVTFGMRFDY